MIILIIFLGLVLRLVNLNQSLWLDEAISALAARDFTYNGIIFDFLKIDNHPPLFYLLLKLWGSVFGFSDLSLRLLPVILGLGVIYFIYKIAFKFTENKSLSLVASIFASTSPLLIYYSQEIRMYILITFLTCVQIWVFLLLEKTKKLKWFLLFSTLNCLLFFSDYITLFLFPVFLLYPIILKNWKLLKKVVLSFIPLGLLFVLWFPMFHSQFIANNQIINLFPGWSSIVGGATFKNIVVTWMKFVIGRISFEPKIAYYGLVILVSLPIIGTLFLSSKQFKKNLLFWFWLIMPLFLGFTFSIFIGVFNYFRFIYVYPAFLILITLGIYEIKKSILKNLLIGAILLVNLIGLSIYYLDPSQQRENWKQAVGFIESQAKSGDIMLFEFNQPFAPVVWYSAGKIPIVAALNSYAANPETDNLSLENKLNDKTGIYYFEYLRDLSDPNGIVEKKMEEEGFKKGEIFNNFYNIGQISYWKR